MLAQLELSNSMRERPAHRRMHDGLPKLKDYPKEMGGSGIAIPE